MRRSSLLSAFLHGGKAIDCELERRFLGNEFLNRSACSMLKSQSCEAIGLAKQGMNCTSFMVLWKQTKQE